MPNKTTRRALLGTGLGLAALALLPLPARAQPEARAQALVAQLSAEALDLIRSGRPESQLYPEFERLLARYGDMPAVAQATLGPPWRSASDAQRRAYVASFQSYLARKYGQQFREFRQAEITIARVRDAGRAGVLVETVVRRPGQADVSVGWQVSEQSGAPRVVNIIIEGISMIATERAEIGAMLEAARGSIDGLIQTLRARA